jgi:hypothetical protein
MNGLGTASVPSRRIPRRCRPVAIVRRGSCSVQCGAGPPNRFSRSSRIRVITLLNPLGPTSQLPRAGMRLPPRSRPTSDSTIERTGGGIGTKCATPFFARSPGMVQSCRSRTNSERSPRTPHCGVTCQQEQLDGRPERRPLPFEKMPMCADFRIGKNTLARLRLWRPPGRPCPSGQLAGLCADRLESASIRYRRAELKCDDPICGGIGALGYEQRWRLSCFWPAAATEVAAAAPAGPQRRRRAPARRPRPPRRRQ